MLIEGSKLGSLVLQLIIQLLHQLQHEPPQDELRGYAVGEQLVQLAPDHKQPLRALLPQDVIRNFLQFMSSSLSLPLPTKSRFGLCSLRIPFAISCRS